MNEIIGESTMKEETIQEVIKALAYGEDIEDIANFAEVTIDEIVSMKLDYEKEINECKKQLGVWQDEVKSTDS